MVPTEMHRIAPSCTELHRVAEPHYSYSYMIKTMIFISFTRKKCLLLEEKAVQFPPCLLNLACSLNYFSKIFHPAGLIQPACLIET